MSYFLRRGANIISNCDFYKYERSDCCILKDKIPGQSHARVNGEIFKNYCRYSDGYKKCPFYEEYLKNKK